MKYDNDKAPLALIPPEIQIKMAEVLGFGAEKYGAWNWRNDGDKTDWSRSYSSIQRHLNSFWSGEDFDPESGKEHLAHALTQIAILLIHVQDHPEMDHRYKKETYDTNS